MRSVDDSAQADGASPGHEGRSYTANGAFVRARGRPAAAVLMVLIAVAFAAGGADGWRPVRNAVFDTFQRLFPRTVREFPVVIVDIDEASLKALGRWPWPRYRLAELTDAVTRLGAMAVGYDIIMPEPDSLSPDVILSRRTDVDPRIRSALAALASNDEILARTLRRTPSVVARAALIGGGGRPAAGERQTAVMQVGEPAADFVTGYAGHLTNIPLLEEAAFGCGYLNDTRDADGVVRTMPLILAVGGELAPSLSLELLRTAVGATWYGVRADTAGVLGVQIGESFIPTDRDGRIRLHFSPAYAQRRVSAVSVLEGRMAPGSFERQVAIIGVTAVGAIDVVATPVTARMDGVEIQAQVVENILAQSRLVRPSPAHRVELGVFFVLCVALIVFLPRMHPVAGIAFFVGALVVLLAGSAAAFVQTRTLLDASFPVAGALPVLLVLLAVGFAEARRRQRELDAALEAEKLERMRMAGELAAARDIQMGMLPDPEAIDRSIPGIDFFARIEPAEEVGGDLYDAFPIDDHRFFFLVGDVAGKGVAAALFMALCKTLAKSTALRGDVDVGEMFRILDAEIARQNPAMLFVTALAGVVNLDDGRLQLCCAGHEKPLLMRPRGGVSPEALDIEAGPPLCVLEDYPYTGVETTLMPGDTLVLLSDGITEAHAPGGELYGKARVLRWLEASQRTDPSAAGICNGLFADIRRFAAGAPQSDDITVMALGFLGHR
ncbi:MAG: CHASE2 domain-containing protein [Desulfobacteraceae bacterium]|nr:CHASE2 domain-containing protein [Desulfobacteraceae bacterium]